MIDVLLMVAASAAASDQIEEPAALLDLGRIAVLSCTWQSALPPAAVRWVASEGVLRRRARALTSVLEDAGCAGEAAALKAVTTTGSEPHDVLFRAYDECASAAHATALVVACHTRASYYGATGAGVYPAGNWDWLMSHPDSVRCAAGLLPPADAELVSSYVLPSIQPAER